MRELLHDPFYELIEHYPRCGVEYCLIEADAPHQGYRSHKDAVLFAALKVIERDFDEQLRDEPFPWSLDMEKARARQIEVDALLHVPEIVRTDRVGQRHYDCGLPDPLKGEQIPYWYAFWETPHPSGYGPDDFRKVNAALFPEGAGDRHDLYAERSERYLLDLSLQILKTGTDVVLDWGLWTRAVRTRVRGFYTSRGIPCELHYLRIPAEEWARRIARRNAQLQSGSTSAYFVDEGLLRKAESLFEEPSPEEIDRLIDC